MSLLRSCIVQQTWMTFVFTVLLELMPGQILKNSIHNATSIVIIQKFLMLKRVAIATTSKTIS